MIVRIRIGVFRGLVNLGVTAANHECPPPYDAPAMATASPFSDNR